MKFRRFLFALFLGLSAAGGAEWPAPFEQIEATAAAHPAHGLAAQLWRYASSAKRMAELRERWSARATGPDAWRYRLLLGGLANFGHDVAEARVQFGKAAELAPTEAEVWLLLGQFEAGERPEAARPALEKAVELGHAGEAVTALARDHISNGRDDEALAVWAREWPKVAGASARQTLLHAWLPFAFTRGRLAEAMTGLEEAHRSGRDPLAFLAQAYALLQEDALAASLIERARAGHADDAGLRAVALRTIRPGGDRTLLRLLQEAAGAAPSPAAWAEVLRELVRLGMADEAQSVLATQAAELRAGPASWGDCVPGLWRLGLTGNALAVLDGGADSWETKMARADLQIAQGELGKARETLWLVFTARDGEPLSSVARAFDAPADFRRSPLPDGDYFSRRAVFHSVLSFPPEIFNVKAERTRLPPEPLHTLPEARDRALLYLAMIARETKSEPAFLERLGATLATEPLEEQVFAWAAVESPRRLLDAMERCLEQPALAFSMNAFCHAELARLDVARGLDATLRERARRLRLGLERPRPREKMAPVPEADPLTEERLSELADFLKDAPQTLETLRRKGWRLTDQQFGAVARLHPDLVQEARVIEPDGPATRGYDPGRPALVLRAAEFGADGSYSPVGSGASPGLRMALAEFAAGHFAEAVLAFRSAAWKPRVATPPFGDSPASALQGMALGISRFGPDAKQSTEAAAAVVKCLAVAPVPAVAFPGRLEGTAIWPEGRPLSVELMRPMTLPGGFPAGPRGPIAAGRPPGRPFTEFEPPAELRGKLFQPPPALMSLSAGPALWSILSATYKEWAPLKANLEALPPELSAEEARRQRLALCYLEWWHAEWDEAEAGVRRLLAETGEDGLRIALAGMLRTHGQGAEAAALLGEVKLPYPAFRRVVTMWQLRIAAEEKDAARVAVLARDLVDAPLTRGEIRPLLTALAAGGFSAEAAPFRERLIRMAQDEQTVGGLKQAFEDLAEARDTAVTDALARRVLAGSLRTAERVPSIRQCRGLALVALERIGARQAYADELAQLAKSVENQLRLAEATPGAPAALAALLEVRRLEPAHALAARTLLTVATIDDATRMLAYETLLAGEPEETMGEYAGRMLDFYAQAHALPRLAERLSKAPFRTGSDDFDRFTNEHSWQEIADRMTQENETAAALLVQEKRRDILGEWPPESTSSFVVQSTAAARRNPTGPEILRRLAPVPPAVPELFAFQDERMPTFPLQPEFVPELIKMAHAMGLGPELRRRLARTTAQPDVLRRTLLLLGVLEREPEALAQVREFTAQLGTPGGWGRQWVMPVAVELAVWPEAKETLLTLLTAIDASDRTTGRGRIDERLPLAKLAATAGLTGFVSKSARSMLEDAKAQPSLAEYSIRNAMDLALSAGEPELIRRCAQALAGRFAPEHLRPEAEILGALDTVGALSDAGFSDAASSLLAAVQKRIKPSFSREYTLTAMALTAEAGLRCGLLDNVAPVAWLDIDRSTPGRATIAWDLGLHLDDGAPTVRGEALPAMSDDYVVELFFGPTKDVSQIIAHLPQSKPRGSWQGTLPAAEGYVRAVLTKGDRIWLGEAEAFTAGPNLLRENGSPLDLLPGTQTAKGGPALEGVYCVFPSGNPGAIRVAIAQRQVRLEPARDYVLSAWLRRHERGTVRLGFRFLDEASQPIGEIGYFETVWVHRWWHYTTETLQGFSSKATGAFKIPKGAAYLVPVIESGFGGADVAGLSLVLAPISPRE